MWTRFGLSLAAVILLVLSQRAFASVVSGFVQTGTARLDAVLAYLALGILAGVAFGLAVLLPRRLRLRHPRRALTLAIMPILVTGLNITLALTPSGTLPQVIAEFAVSYTLGLQTVASAFLGLAVASALVD